MSAKVKSKAAGNDRARRAAERDLHNSRTFARTMSNTLLLYLFIVVSFIPLFYWNGPARIGSEKAVVYVWTATPVLLLAVALLLVSFVRVHPETKTDKMVWLAMIIMLVTEFITFIAACDHYTAWSGFGGWQMGFHFRLLCICFCFIAVIRGTFARKFPEEASEGPEFFEAIAKNGKGKASGTTFRTRGFIPNFFTFFLPLTLIGADVVFFISILNHFSMPVVDLKAGTYLVSTIGNSNWYCGFLCTILPFAIGLLYMKNTAGWERVLIYFSVFLGFSSAVVVASESIAVALTVILIAVVCIGFASRRYMMQSMAVLLMLGLACIFLRILGTAFPTAFYASGFEATLQMQIFLNPRNFILLTAVAAGILAALYFMEKKQYKWGLTGALRVLVTILPFLIVIGVIALLIFQLNFRLPDKWGSSRGVIWKYSNEMYTEMPAGRKLFGVGQDCMGVYPHDYIPRLFYQEKETFGGATLQNSHSSMLTLLLNNGAVGVGAFLFLIFAVMWRIRTEVFEAFRPFRKKKIPDDETAAAVRPDPDYLYDGGLKWNRVIALLTIVSYIANCSVSFDTALVLPAMFIFIML